MGHVLLSQPNIYNNNIIHHYLCYFVESKQQPAKNKFSAKEIVIQNNPIQSICNSNSNNYIHGELLQFIL